MKLYGQCRCFGVNETENAYFVQLSYPVGKSDERKYESVSGIIPKSSKNARLLSQICELKAVFNNRKDSVPVTVEMIKNEDEIFDKEDGSCHVNRSGFLQMLEGTAF